MQTNINLQIKQNLQKNDFTHKNPPPHNENIDKSVSLLKWQLIGGIHA